MSPADLPSGFSSGSGGQPSPFKLELNLDLLGDSLEGAYCFKGSADKPLLAPRGIHLVSENSQDEKSTPLLVSDTGHNRVFIWKKVPTSLYQEPDVILGQENTADFGRNAGKSVGGSTLQYPSGVWSDGKKVVVADAWNHRVLIWHSMPTGENQSADVVIGQRGFKHNEPNLMGIGHEPSARSLHWPYGVYSDGISLWVADTGNRRVLWFANIPTSSYAAADKVIGQPNLTTRDYDNQHALWPYSVKVSDSGSLAIADTQFYRSLIWKSKDNAFTQPADVIVGQKNFNDCGQNQLGLFPSQSSLNWTYDTCFYKEGIFVNDTGNSRILWYEKVPTQNSELATAVIGKESFSVGSENMNTLHGTASSLYWAFALSIKTVISENDIMGIADTGNHRLVIGGLKL